jgi:hypothetical protein
MTYDVLTGVAVQLRTWDGPSLFYSTGSQMELLQLPGNDPQPPQLGIALDRNTGRLTLTCPTENQGTVTLMTSIDGGRTWAPVPNYEDLPAQGVPVVLQIDPTEKSALYYARVR